MNATAAHDSTVPFGHRSLAPGRGGTVTALAALAALAGSAGAQVNPVHSLSDVPGAALHEIDNPSPCGAHFRPAFVVSAGGHDVTVSYYSEVAGDHEYLIGCTNWSDPSWDSRRDPPDPAVNPGNFIADYNSSSDGAGDLIINFSEPVSGYGSTSILMPFNIGDADSMAAFDGPDGTGNVLGEVSTAAPEFLRLKLEFMGFAAAGPIIRSIRYPIHAGMNFSIDEIAVAVGSPCRADFNGDNTADFFDYLDFVAAFDAEDPAADFNGDNSVDFFDYLDFAAAFDVGCG